MRHITDVNTLAFVAGEHILVHFQHSSALSFGVVKSTKYRMDGRIDISLDPGLWLCYTGPMCGRFVREDTISLPEVISEYKIGVAESWDDFLDSLPLSLVISCHLFIKRAHSMFVAE